MNAGQWDVHTQSLAMILLSQQGAQMTRLVCWQSDDGLHDLRDILLDHSFAFCGNDSLCSNGLQYVVRTSAHKYCCTVTLLPSLLCSPSAILRNSIGNIQTAERSVSDLCHPNPTTISTLNCCHEIFIDKNLRHTGVSEIPTSGNGLGF